MFVVQVLAVLSIGSVTLARIGTMQKVVDVEEEEEEVVKHDDSEYEDKTCKSYDRVIAPKIAQNINGIYKYNTMLIIEE